MGRAGVLLRISQSAVSKRIASLETETGKKLIEKKGRRVALTPDAEHLINKIGPMLADIRFELKVTAPPIGGEIQLGVSESILSSWGAKILQKVERSIAPTSLALHAHRGPLLTQLVTSGTYLAAIIAGEPGNEKGSLTCIEIGTEPMVLIEGENSPIQLISIEPQAATWQAIKRRAVKCGLVPDRYVESYFSAASLAVAGFGRALVPAGVANAIKLPRHIKITEIKNLARPLCILARKHVFARNEIIRLIEVATPLLQAEPWNNNKK